MKARWLKAAVPVHVTDFGGEGDPFVVLHGLDASGLTWTRAGPLLAGHGRVFAPDLLGHGFTPPAPRPGIDENAAIVERLLDETGPAVLFGSSMGGLVALATAARAPEEVRALVLIAPAVPGVPPSRLTGLRFLFQALPLLGPLFLRARARILGPRGIVEKNLVEPCIAREERLPHDLVEAIVLEKTLRFANMSWCFGTSSVAVRSVLAYTRSWRAFFALAGRVRCPVLLVHGTADDVMPIDSSRRLAACRGWRLVEIAGVGHLPQLESPAKFLAAIERRLPEVLGSGRLVPSQVPSEAL